MVASAEKTEKQAASSPFGNFFSTAKQSAKNELPFAIGIPALIWQILFFFLPLILIFLSSVWVSGKNLLNSFSLKYFAQVFDVIYFKIILNSISLALFTTALCLIIAFPLAYFITFRAKKWKNLLLFFLVIPFWTNFLLHIYAWFFVLEQQGFLNTLLLKIGLIASPIHFLNTPFAVMLMMVYYFLPFMVLPIYSSLENIDHNLMEASLDLGANWSQTVRKILLPLSLSGIRSGIFLVYIPAFGEFVIPELMGGDKQYFAGSVISQFILGDKTAPLGAAFTVVSCLMLLVTLVGIFVGLKAAKRALTKRAIV